MDPRNLLDVRNWLNLAVEAAVRLGCRMHSLEGVSWYLPPDVRERVVLRWPESYAWVATKGAEEQIRDMLGQRVRVVIAPIPQPYKGTIVTEFQIDGRVHEVAFNVNDHPEFLSEESARRSLVTFKFQYLKTGYGLPNIVPGGFIPLVSWLYQMLPLLRRAKDRWTSRFQVYARFSMQFAPGIRGAALRALRTNRAFTLQGGDRKVRYSRYLRELARAMVCVDLPGEAPFCTRLVEYLAVGSCVVAVPYPTQFQAPLMDGVHVIYCQPDARDLVALCEALLGDPARRRRMELAAREFFDRYLHRDQLSAYYLATVLAASGAS
ncbi:MAG: hypothetical protein DMD41_10750 [Gemmatimonadetes bacterium]|uniref:Glycosyltransferase family 1 protein n=1 Tax=Candidatus Segetimicrobium genomatis TaxID=2569760 RepID=A0A537KKU3_9BACT|nr:MAG: hypothetical protein DMD41_10750 [Gemmatimonadota bacterium]TMI96397.1 MAG: glycosyltransferase family 1 protein [Terrabacteria group bacterium ANGP1]